MWFISKFIFNVEFLRIFNIQFCAAINYGGSRTMFFVYLQLSVCVEWCIADTSVQFRWIVNFQAMSPKTLHITPAIITINALHHYLVMSFLMSFQIRSTKESWWALITCEFALAWIRMFVRHVWIDMLLPFESSLTDLKSNNVLNF